MQPLLTECDLVLGIDPSLTSLAAVRVWPAMLRTESRLVASKPLGKTAAARIQRYNQIVAQVLLLLEARRRPLVCLEGYSYGSQGASGVTLGEFGGVLRWSLVASGATVVEVAPATLKQFVLGKGAGDKSQMRLGVYKRWGVEFATDDEVDGYALAMMGCCLAGWSEPENQAQREAIEKVRQPFES